MAASSLSKNASSPSATKSASQLPRLTDGVNMQNEVDPHQFSMPSKNKNKSTPFDDILGQDNGMVDQNRRMSDLSEMDYLAKTAMSNNLMTGAGRIM